MRSPAHSRQHQCAAAAAASLPSGVRQLSLRALRNVTEGMCDAKVGVAVPTLGQGCSAAAATGRRCCGAGAVSGRRTSRRRPAHSAAQYSTGRAWPRYLLESPRRTATAHCSHAAGCDEPPLFPEVISHASPLQARFRRRASAGGGKLRLFRGAPDLYSGSRAEHRALGQPQALGNTQACERPAPQA